jgi:phosphoglycolate phosphatase
MKPKTIVFDLDGTLVDSLPDILRSFRRSFEVLGLPVPGEDAVREHVGKPLEEMYAHFAPEGHVEALAAEYRRYYPKHFTDHSRPFPGVLELLGTLRAEGYLIAVATTKRSDMARALVKALDLERYLDHVQGTDGFPSKPAPDVIFRALSRLSGEGTWMVGDTTHDVLAGKAADLKTYAVSWGSHDQKRLASASPDVLAGSLDGLLEHL